MDCTAYRLEQRGACSAYVLREEYDAVSRAFFDGDDCVPAGETGRAAVRYFPLNDGEGVLRVYRRGGWMAKWARDGYLGNRMLREFELMIAYRAAGGLAPEPLGVYWERRGFVYRGAIATRRLAGTTLLQVLNHARAEERGERLREAGRVIADMHAQGFWHADLQLKNILVAEEKVWMIDFDKGRRCERLGRVARARNLLRLRRSFEKHGVSLDNFATLLEGYGPVFIPGWLRLVYWLRGARRRGRANS